MEQSSLLLSLPPEIRDIIYGFLYIPVKRTGLRTLKDSKNGIKVEAYQKPALHPVGDPSIFLVCKQINEEVRYLCRYHSTRLSTPTIIVGITTLHCSKMILRYAWAHKQAANHLRHLQLEFSPTLEESCNMNDDVYSIQCALRDLAYILEQGHLKSLQTVSVCFAPSPLYRRGTYKATIWPWLRSRVWREFDSTETEVQKEERCIQSLIDIFRCCFAKPVWNDIWKELRLNEFVTSETQRCSFNPNEPMRELHKAFGGSLVLMDIPCYRNGVELVAPFERVDEGDGGDPIYGHNTALRRVSIESEEDYNSRLESRRDDNGM